MQIRGTTNPFAYRTLQGGESHPRRVSLRAGPAGDSVNLSTPGRELAGKLVIGHGVIATSSRKSLNALSNPSMRLMGESLMEVKELLEEMKALAGKARDSSLSWNDRIDLQIEMADLQLALYEKTHKMGVRLAMPDRAGYIFDSNIHDQHERTVLLLERLRSGGAGSSVERNITVPPRTATEAPANEMCLISACGFYHRDFELDQNGYLKVQDDLFQAMPEWIKWGLADTLHNFAGSSWLFPVAPASNEEALAQLDLSLMDAGRAALSEGAIQKQIDALSEAEAEFNLLAAVDPVVGYEYDKSGGLRKDLFQTALGPMTYKSYRDDGGESLDVRLTEAKDPVAKLFKKIDDLFKDRIYSSLGFGELYQNERKAIGVNPEQLAELEQLRLKKMAEEAGKEKTEERYPYVPLDLEQAESFRIGQM